VQQPIAQNPEDKLKLQKPVIVSQQPQTQFIKKKP